MLGAMDLLKAAGRNFEETVAAVPDTAWDNDTPCGIVLSEVVDHVVTGNLFSALVLMGAPTEQARGVLTGGHLGEDPVGAVAPSCARQHAAFTAADPAVPVPHPIGDISLGTFLRFRIGDLVVHAWDIARGANLNETLPPTLVEPLWDMVMPHLEEMRAMGTFGDGASLDPSAETPLQSRLLDAFGRRT